MTHPTDTIRTIREALENVAVHTTDMPPLGIWGYRIVPLNKALTALSTLEASLKAEEASGISVLDELRCQEHKFDIGGNQYVYAIPTEMVLHVVRTRFRTTEPVSGNAEQLPPAGDVVETLIACQFFIKGNWWRLRDNSPRLLLDRIERAIAAMNDYAGELGAGGDGHQAGFDSPSPAPAPATFHGTHGDSVEVEVPVNDDVAMLKECIAEAHKEWDLQEGQPRPETIGNQAYWDERLRSRLVLVWQLAEKCLPYLRPAPVSLEAAARALVSAGSHNSPLTATSKELTKACAEAWGLEYVD